MPAQQPENEPRIIAAGLSDDLVEWLREQLDPAIIRPVADAEAALPEIDAGCDLLILNHSLSGPAAYDVLTRLRADPRHARLPVLYLLDGRLDSALGRAMIEQLGVIRLLVQPVEREAVAASIAGILGLRLAEERGRTLTFPALRDDEPRGWHGEVPAYPGAGDHALILVVDEDRQFGESIAAEATARGLQASAVSAVSTAREEITRKRPDLVVLDLAFPSTADDGLGLLKALNNLNPPVPVLVLTARDTFIDRVQVASLGGRGFLQKTLPPADVMDAVVRLLQQLRAAEGRVMAVDDDPAVLAGLRSLLEPLGVALTTLDDPLRFWDALEQSTPDLLVLDLDMPRLSGIELCRVVRNDARWNTLPVLFLTASNDPETVRRVFAAGADDFVTKPMVGPELVTKVVNRLERTQLYRNMAEIDPVTGVSNRRKSTQTIWQYLRLAQRHNQPLSVALLDIDFFKQINDRFGHGTGDSVLQQLGRLLLRTFRGEDVVARWGGEEFLVGMYGMTRVDGVQRLTDLLETLHHESFAGPHGERIHVTFSAGVAQYPEDGTDVQTLYRAADGALYRAKEAGRDRVMAVGWHPERMSRDAQMVDVALVDDDDALGSQLIHALEVRGYRTYWFKEGEAAALMLSGEEPSVRAQVILLALDLPGMDGQAVLRRLHRDGITSQTRIILLAPGGRQEEMARAVELGAFDQVTKPVSLPVLVQRVRRAMEIL